MEEGSTSSHYSSLASKTSEYSEEAHPLVKSLFRKHMKKFLKILRMFLLENAISLWKKVVYF